MTLGTSSFEAKDYPLADVLFAANARFQIPRYQRPYAWSEDQFSELWDDLQAADRSFFLGSFIFNKEYLAETGFVDVIDGQQRMLTITILIAVLRDIVRPIDQKLAQLIQRQDIAQEDREGNESFRIKCGESAREYFEQFIQGTDSSIATSEPATPEHKRIKACYEFYAAKVAASLKQRTSNSDKVMLVERLRKKLAELKVIRVEIASEEDAYEIFETTNARGVDLSIADLLKNLIFKKIRVRDDRDMAKEIWENIVENVESTNSEMKRFISYFWMSRYGFVREKQLFKTIKTTITDWDALLQDLWDDSRLYKKLLDLNEADWRDYGERGTRIYRSVLALQLMNVTQCHVLFLSLLRNHKQTGSTARIFELVERFSLCYAAVCKKPGNRVEHMYSRFAVDIQKAATGDAQNKKSEIDRILASLETSLHENWPVREEFINSFSEVCYANSPQKRKLVKYILGGISDLKGTGEYKIDFDNVNIEHVLPRKPTKWGLTAKAIKPYVNKLGNLTLVKAEFNSRIGNNVLTDKLPELSESEIPMTIELVREIKENGVVWNESSINQRHLHLGEIAYDEVWTKEG